MVGGTRASRAGRWVRPTSQVLKGRADRWDRWTEIRRVNPLVEIAPEFREAAAGRAGCGQGKTRRLKARFQSYRPQPADGGRGIPSLVTAEDWGACEVDALPERIRARWFSGLTFLVGGPCLRRLRTGQRRGGLQGICAFPASDPDLKTRGRKGQQWGIFMYGWLSGGS